MKNYSELESWKKTIGQQEGLRLEFKSQRIFDDKNKAIEELTKQISAFANTEGGNILIGIEERKEGKIRIASQIAGLNSGNDVAPEWLQQTLESNIKPYLIGLRIFRILDDNKHVLFNIFVPKGKTAYQAKDFKYYGRSEFECKALQDHEIRLRMMLGQQAQASMKIIEYKITTSKEMKKNRKEREKKAKEMNVMIPSEGDFNYHILSVNLGIYNNSDVTIRDFLLKIEIDSPYLTSKKEIISEYPKNKENLTPNLIFPHDITPYPTHHTQMIVFKIPLNINSIGDSVISWKVFLDNAPPCFGDIVIDKHSIKEILDNKT